MATPSYRYFGLTGDPIIDGMTHGYYWGLTSDRTVDWSLSDGFLGEYWTQETGAVVTLFLILEAYSQYANIKFNYLGHFASPLEAAQRGSEINFSLDAGLFFSNPSTWARGYFPNPDRATDYQGQAGDIYLNMQSQSVNLGSYGPGSAGWFVFLHEIGHVLGLKHPHDTGGTGRPTLTQGGLSDLDIDWATAMSYADSFDWNMKQWDPTSPMILDVLALQFIYGKNLATNAGDSVHKLDITNTYFTIWDASGNDTVSATGSLIGWTIRLPDRQLSQLVDTKSGLALPTAEVDLPSPHTLYWLAGDMENATGGSGNDRLYGNAANNRLDGGPGDDVLLGGPGNDSFDFDPATRGGSDVFYGGTGDDSYVLNSLLDSVIENPSEGVDTIWVPGTYSLGSLPNVENLRSIGADGLSLTGNASNNYLTGAPGGDTIDGGGGNDTLYGKAGNDTLIGGEGVDLAVFVGNRVGYVITPTASGYTVNGTDGTDTLAGVESVKFDDQTVILSSVVIPNAPPSGVVTISGTPTEGQTLTAFNSLADNDGLGPLSYQWLRAGNVIAAGTSTSYKLGQEDVGSTISVRVSYTDGRGTLESKISDATVAVSGSDSASPIVTNLSPADEATDVAVGSNIAIAFNEAIQSGSGNITIVRTTTSALALTLTDAANPTDLTGFPVNGVTFKLDGVSYSVPLTSGVSNTYVAFNVGLNAALNANPALAALDSTLNANNSITITDLHGRDFVGTGYTFIGGVVPAAASLTWNFVATAASTTVVETMNAVIGGSLSVSGSVLTINPATELAYGTGYKVLLALDVVKDLAGNAFAGSGSYNFATVAGATNLTFTGTDIGESIYGADGNDTLSGLGGNDVLVGRGGNDNIDGGIGMDTATYSGPRAGYAVSTTFGVTFVRSIAEGDDYLYKVERLKFSDKSIALDTGAAQSGGGAALIVGAVLGRASLIAKPDLVGAIIGLFDQGFSLQQLSGAVMRLDVWGVLAGGNSDAQIATYLLTTVNGVAPDTPTLSTAVSSLANDPQGDFLWHLAESAANQSQVGLVGLAATGLEFLG